MVKTLWGHWNWQSKVARTYGSKHGNNFNYNMQQVSTISYWDNGMYDNITVYNCKLCSVEQKYLWS